MMRCCLVVLAALGAGCSVGPDYRAPEPVETGWAGSDDAANEAAAYDPQWWRSFGDPVLDRLVTRAAADNLELAAAAARVRQARAQRRAARSTLFPSIGGEASYTNYQLSKNGPGITGDAVEQGLTERDDSFYTAGFDAAYEIDIFGGNRRRRESAAAGEQLALERRRGVMLTVVAEVAREYMELRGAQKRLAITEKNAALQRDLTALVERKYRAGLSRELDVVRARSQTRVVEALVPALRSQIRGSAYRLGVLTGQPPEALLEELLTSNPIPGAPEIVPVGLRSELLRRRPDVRAAERALAQASAEIGVATAEMFPKFVLAGDVAWESVDRGDWFDEDSQRWSLVPFVDWRIFEGGRLRAQVEFAEAISEEQAALYEQTVLAALADAEAALVSYGEERRTRRTLDEASAASERAAELARRLYDIGLSDFLDVLDAERRLVEVQDRQVQSETQVAVRLVGLYKALGGGWQSFE